MPARFTNEARNETARFTNVSLGQNLLWSNGRKHWTIDTGSLMFVCCYWFPVRIQIRSELKKKSHHVVTWSQHFLLLDYQNADFSRDHIVRPTIIHFVIATTSLFCEILTHHFIIPTVDTYQVKRIIYLFLKWVQALCDFGKRSSHLLVKCHQRVLHHLL